jgi:hypothetical protein
MRHASLCLDYPPRQAKLVVFQAISDQDFKAVVILTKFVHFFPFQVTGPHTRCPSPKAICSGVAFLVDAFPGKSGQILSFSIGRRDLFMILK